MGFSFNETAGTSQSTAQPKLAGNAIYDVIFDGCEIKDVKGVKDPDALYKQLIIKFKNEDGVFEHTVWEPKEDDFVRKETEYTKDGKVNKIPQPSNVESMMLLFKHLIDSVNPKVAKQIDNKELPLNAPNWDKLRELVIKITTPGKGAPVKIKLLKNSKSGEAVFPGFFASISKEGVCYIKNNFIGPKIAFSTYEIQRIQNESGKPSAPPATFGAGFAVSDLSKNDLMEFSMEGL